MSPAGGRGAPEGPCQGTPKFAGVLVLGLAGTYCSGKSTIARSLETQGAVQIDLDRMGHLALQQEALRVVETFGPGVVAQGSMPADNADNADNAVQVPLIDRKALGRIVFADPGALKQLESITHPVMKNMVLAQIKEYSRQSSHTTLVVVNGALLFPMGLDALCDVSVFVTAPCILRLWRGLRRDHLGVVQTFRRIQSQKGLFPNPSASDADIPIVGSWTSRKALGRIVAILDRMKGVDS